MAKEVDTSKDDKLKEKDALKLAKKDGIEFVDHWTVEGEVDERGIEVRFDSEKAAKKVAGKRPIVQHRERKQ